MSARILSGSAGWYVVEPLDFGAVSLRGPMLSMELAYAVAEEVDAHNRELARAVLQRFREAHVRGLEAQHHFFSPATFAEIQRAAR